MAGDPLVELRLQNARAALEAGRLDEAGEWLDGLSARLVPDDMTVEWKHRQAKVAMAEGRWGRAQGLLEAACRFSADPHLRQRLALIRRRPALMDDHTWEVLSESVDVADRLPSGLLRPEVAGVWACGAYYSRGRGRAAPWTHLLRLSKSHPTEDRDAAVVLAAGYLCRWAATRSPLLRDVDVVVPVPANPARYGARMMSLPDELARAIEGVLAVPSAFDALEYAGSDGLDLRGLGRAERYRQIVGAFRVGSARVIAGRSVLVVDDVVTSGATLRECGRVLQAANAAAVYGLCLAHTEG